MQRLGFERDTVFANILVLEYLYTQKISVIKIATQTWYSSHSMTYSDSKTKHVEPANLKSQFKFEMYSVVCVSMARLTSVSVQRIPTLTVGG